MPRFWAGLAGPLVRSVLPSFLAGSLLYWLDVRRSTASRTRAGR